MNRFTNAVLAILFLIGVSVVYAQQQTSAAREGSALSPPEYRVMSLAEMFVGDDEAQKKIAQLSFTVRSDDESVRVARTDMDARDYERALNRLGREGWTLVTVNKSNYWVFQKSPAK